MPTCERCERDPKPTNFGSARGCAFPSDSYGKNPAEIFFSPDNWNCATITALLDEYDPDRRKTIYGNDESLDLVPAVPADGDFEPEPRGWLVLTRYKRRGKVSSIVYVGDFYQPEAVSLALVETTIAYWRERRASERATG